MATLASFVATKVSFKYWPPSFIISIKRVYRTQRSIETGNGESTFLFDFNETSNQRFTHFILNYSYYEVFIIIEIHIYAGFVIRIENLGNYFLHSYLLL